MCSSELEFFQTLDLTASDATIARKAARFCLCYYRKLPRFHGYCGNKSDAYVPLPLIKWPDPLDAEEWFTNVILSGEAVYPVFGLPGRGKLDFFIIDRFESVQLEVRDGLGTLAQIRATAQRIQSQ